MNNRAYALMTGLFILVLGSALVLAALWLTGSREATTTYVVTSDASVYGLQPESSVFYRGIKVGRVRSIEFADNNPDQIRIRIAVNQSVPLSRDVFATLKLQGVTGLSQLALESNGNSQQRLDSPPDHPAEIPMKPSMLDRLGDQGNQLMARLDRITRSLGDLLNQDNQAHIQSMIASFNEVAGNLAELTDSLNQGAARVPDMAARLDRNIAGLDKLLGNLNELAGEATGVTRRVDDLVRNAGQVARTGNEISAQVSSHTLPALNETLDEIRQTSESLRQLSQSLRRNPQQLITGPSRPASGPGESGYGGLQ